MYKVELSRATRRFFERSNASLQRRLDRCFDQLKIDPRNAGSIKRLSGELADRFRYRVGDYRVIYRIDDQGATVRVVKIAHRSEAYG